MNRAEAARPLNKRPIQINNILEDYSNTQTMTEKLNQLFSQAYYIAKTYGFSLVQLVFMMLSMAISNVYSFIFKKEKSIRDQVVLLTGSAGYLGKRKILIFEFKRVFYLFAKFNRPLISH